MMCYDSIVKVVTVRAENSSMNKSYISFSSRIDFLSSAINYPAIQYLYRIFTNLSQIMLHSHFALNVILTLFVSCYIISN